MAYFLVPVLDSKYCGLAAGRSQISTTCISKKSKDPYLALRLHILKSCVCVSDLKIIETRGVKTWTLLPGCFDFNCFQEHWREQNGNRVQREALRTRGEASLEMDIRDSTVAFPKTCLFVFHYVFKRNICTQVHAALEELCADFVWWRGGLCCVRKCCGFVLTEAWLLCLSVQQFKSGSAFHVELKLVRELEWWPTLEQNVGQYANFSKMSLWNFSTSELYFFAIKEK